MKHDGEAKKTVSANLAISAEAHMKMRMLAQKTGLTNSEIVGGLLEGVKMEDIEKALEKKVSEKREAKTQRQQLAKEVNAMSPEKVKKILAALKKGSDDQAP